MTLTEKVRALIPTQREAFNIVKDEAGLEKFLAETGVTLTDEERAQTSEFLKSGKLPLEDEELTNVAGGCGNNNENPNDKAGWQRAAEPEGRGVQVGHRTLLTMEWRSAQCGSCKTVGSLFAARYDERKDTSSSFGGAMIITYSDCKCYKCGNRWTSLNFESASLNI